MLTTNLKTSLDSALERRLSFKISFPFPEAATRATIWRHLLPDTAPLAPDLDFDMLGDCYELSGGSIKNAVLRAAYRAAASARRCQHGAPRRRRQARVPGRGQAVPRAAPRGPLVSERRGHGHGHHNLPDRNTSRPPPPPPTPPPRRSPRQARGARADRPERTPGPDAREAGAGGRGPREGAAGGEARGREAGGRSRAGGGTGRRGRPRPAGNRGPGARGDAGPRRGGAPGRTPQARAPPGGPGGGGGGGGGERAGPGGGGGADGPPTPERPLGHPAATQGGRGHGIRGAAAPRAAHADTHAARLRGRPTRQLGSEAAGGVRVRRHRRGSAAQEEVDDDSTRSADRGVRDPAAPLRSPSRRRSARLAAGGDRSRGGLSGRGSRPRSARLLSSSAWGSAPRGITPMDPRGRRARGADARAGPTGRLGRA